MRREYIIDNKTFIYKGVVDGFKWLQNAHLELSNCYKKPSIIKQSIYNEWLEWAYKNNFSMWVKSYNTNIFTLAFYGEYNGKKVALYVTPTRQEIYNVI